MSMQSSYSFSKTLQYATQVELVKTTGQQFSAAHLLEVFRGSLNQFVCPDDRKCFHVFLISYALYFDIVIIQNLGQKTRT